jgi:cellulose synthase/poly-beta-1,6-N-acetylglucosamine synthase-like glycosyltransferase
LVDQEKTDTEQKKDLQAIQRQYERHMRARSSLLFKLAVLTAFVFGVLAILIIFTQTFILLVTLIATIVLSAYLLAALKRQKKGPPGKRLQVSFGFTFGLLLIPIVVAGIYSSEQFNAHSIYSMIIAFGMALTFMYSMINVPLTIYHKKLEEKRDALRATPLVSIIIPAYNEEKIIRKTLDSIIELDYPAMEVIVVDDGSTDNTYAVARGYKEKMSSALNARKRASTMPDSFGGSLQKGGDDNTTINRNSEDYLVISKPNGGKASAINYGIRFATSEYVISIDADSIMGRDAIKEIIKYFQQEDVVAVGGNIKVKNRNSLLTYCQALEYLVGINLFKRAYDVFGVVMVIPGPLGGFRKKVLLERGEYDTDTLTEDFDTTIKALKTGRAVQASSHAISYTEAPETVSGLYKQRLRWNRGNLQTLIKHKDIIANSRFGMLQKYGYPLVFLTMVTLPFLSMVVAAFIILALLNGEWFFILVTFLNFVALEALLAAIAVIMDEEDWKLVLFSPLLVIGYKHLVDIFSIKSVIDVICKRNLKWTSEKINTK